jgi:hypothetical protein
VTALGAVLSIVWIFIIARSGLFGRHHAIQEDHLLFSLDSSLQSRSFERSDLHLGLLAAPVLSLKLTEEILGPDKVIIEDAACDLEQITDQRVSHRVAHTDAFFAASHDVGRAENGELLRDHRLVDTQSFLQLLDASLPGDQQLQNPDPDRVSEGPEERGLECLQFISGDFSHVLGVSSLEQRTR